MEEIQQFINGVKIYHFKAKDSEINAYSLCLGNISEEFINHNMKKKGLYGYVYDFSVDYDNIGIDDILDIHKQLMKKNNMIQMFGSIKKVSIALLNFSGGDKVPSPIKCISLNNQSCMTTTGRVYFRKKSCYHF